MDDDVSVAQRVPTPPDNTLDEPDVEMTDDADTPIDMEVDSEPEMSLQVQQERAKLSRRGRGGSCLSMLPSDSNATSTRQLAQQPAQHPVAIVPSTSVQPSRREDFSLSDRLVFGPTRLRQTRISSQSQPPLLAAGSPKVRPSTAPSYSALPPSQNVVTQNGTEPLLLENGEKRLLMAILRK
ncbi:hypothetical protein GN244_ATG00786 [Phytophthora infestans]|uniref:Uncharacterized protein n=1 Tax=Phytophthora infestans TaxID=4787 RepID=A0A833SW16_PHYIN|nr:hypothetical protein GN244_ATG00786 [Phytophthora infestans]